MENLTVNENQDEVFLMSMEKQIIDEQWLRVGDVAKKLGVSEKTVHRLVQRGELVGYKMGRILQFRPLEIEEYLKRIRTDNKITG